MFVVTDLLALQNPETDENGKTIMSFFIVIVNAVSTSLYPMYKFFNAWSESGEIDFSFVKDTDCCEPPALPVDAGTQPGKCKHEIVGHPIIVP